MAESLDELPPNVLSEIFSRLPIKSLFVCKSVCKVFLSLTSSNPHFNSLISSNTTRNLIIQFEAAYDPSSLLHFVDPELDTACEFGQKINLKPMFQIPQYPAEHLERYSVSAKDENGFLLINSCNGLLYFAEQREWERSFVCNPITNEYAPLPEHDVEKLKRKMTMGLWFGFSEGGNQYKVLRIFKTITGRPWEIDYKVEFWAQVHVVGSCLWRNIEDKRLPTYLSWDTYSVFLNGVVYWLCRFPEMSKFIIFFDFQKEKFGEILPPPDLVSDLPVDRYMEMSIGVLGSNLCVIENTQYLDIWFMKKCGSETSWTKEFVVDTTIPTGKQLEGAFRPLQYLRNGKILMIWNECVLVCYDPKKESFRFFEFKGLTIIAKAVVSTPTFVPLKDALMVDNVAVLNMGPRNPDLTEEESTLMSFGLVELPFRSV